MFSYYFRYVVGSNRVLFMVPDGGKAWDVKDYLVTQENCEEVTIDGQNYPGKGAPKKVTTVSLPSERRTRNITQIQKGPVWLNALYDA